MSYFQFVRTWEKAALSAHAPLLHSDGFRKRSAWTSLPVPTLLVVDDVKRNVVWLNVIGSYMWSSRQCSVLTLFWACRVLCSVMCSVRTRTKLLGHGVAQVADMSRSDLRKFIPDGRMSPGFTRNAVSVILYYCWNYTVLLLLIYFSERMPMRTAVRRVRLASSHYKQIVQSLKNVMQYRGRTMTSHTHAWVSPM